MKRYVSKPVHCVLLVGRKHGPPFVALRRPVVALMGIGDATANHVGEDEYEEDNYQARADRHASYCSHETAPAARQRQTGVARQRRPGKRHRLLRRRLRLGLMENPLVPSAARAESRALVYGLVAAAA